MNKILLPLVVLILISADAKAQNQQGIGLDSYTCRQFLADATKPNDAAKLLRAMMMVSWATGYAAAHNKNELRADGKALAIVSSVLGDSCRHSPDELAMNAVARSIDSYALNPPKP